MRKREEKEEKEGVMGDRRLGRKKELLRVKVQLISQLNRNNKLLQLRKPSKTPKSTP